MKINFITFIFVLNFFLLSNIFAQKNEKVDIEKTSWRFIQMVVTADKMLSEAHQTKDYQFITLSHKYLKYAQNNLCQLKGLIDTTTYNNSQQIIDVFAQVASLGVNPRPQDVLASSIVSIKILHVAKAILKKY